MPDSSVPSAGGARLAHVETQFDESTNSTAAHDIVFAAVDTGDEIARIEIPRPEWSISNLDVSDDWIIVNRAAGEERQAAWILNPNVTVVPALEVPVAGVARFVTAPVTVRPSPLVLRGDGR